MKVAEFERLLEGEMHFPPTVGQKRFFYAFSRFIFSDKAKCCLILQGYAGTGKTTLLGVITRALPKIKVRTVLLAPTGRAAKVLSLHAGKKASTIHKKIYFRETGKDGSSYFVRAKNLHKNTLFIVDEASMIGHRGLETVDSLGGRSLLEDLTEYVYSGQNCKMIVVGDGAQLPPVGCSDSPALNESIWKDHYQLTVARVELKEVMRQALDSGILFNATELRRALSSGDMHLFPKLDIQNFSDVIALNGIDVREQIEETYQNYGSQHTVIITRSNKRANYFNQHIRSQVLWHDAELGSGDAIMVVKNNYFFLKDIEQTSTDFIANGDILDVLSVRNFEERYGLQFVDATVKFRDYPEMAELDVKLVLDAIWEDGPALSEQKQQNLYQQVRSDYLDLRYANKIKEAMKEDPYFNALQVKFAYAVTCHKAQGGQWPVALIDQGYLTEDMLGVDYYRWLYTAFTRASEKLFLMEFDEKFFE